MNRVYIDRLESTEYGTFGLLKVDSLQFFTGELPWLENTPDFSCIPAGTYECSWSYSPKLQRFAYFVEDVPGRTGIRIHPANLVGDAKKGLIAEVNGCIALGKRTGFLNGQKALLLSSAAVDDFEGYLGQEHFVLQIRNNFSAMHQLG